MLFSKCPGGAFLFVAVPLTRRAPDGCPRVPSRAEDQSVQSFRILGSLDDKRLTHS